MIQWLLILLLSVAAVTANAYELGRVEDRMEINDLLARYCSAVDSRDWTAYLAVFTPNATIDYSSNLLGAQGQPVQVARELATSLEVFSVTLHRISNVEIVFTGPRSATVRAMLDNPMYIVGFPVFPVFTVRGWYIHEMVKEEGGWKSSALREDIKIHWEHQLVAMCMLFVVVWRTRMK